MAAVHTPVMPVESMQYLNPEGRGTLMVDATGGEGGHSKAFLSGFPNLKLIYIDADKEIMEQARPHLEIFGDRVQFYSGWSQDFFAEYPVSQKRPDIIIIDLGISFFHYERSRRGFSFKYSEDLDMRLDTSTGFTAAQLIARSSEKELADTLYINADERYSRRIARAIKEAEAVGPVTNSAVLGCIVKRALPFSRRHSSVHPATKTFQALRVAVNGELVRLPQLLEGALRVLDTGGRMGVISFNSAEDRIVKNFFRDKNKDCACPPKYPICRCGGHRIITLLTPKGVTPGKEEILRNPPSRSARLRVIEKILDEVVI